MVRATIVQTLQTCFFIGSPSGLFLAVVEAIRPPVADWWNWYLDQLLHHKL